MSPRLQFCITLVCAVLVGWSLQRLLAPCSPAVPNETSPCVANEAPLATTLSVRFTGTPVHLRIWHGKTLIAEKGVGEESPWEEEIALPVGNMPVELRVSATWEDAVPHAVTLELIPPAQPAREMTRWSDTNTLNDIYIFKW